MRMFTNLLDYRVIGRGGVIFDTVEQLQRLLGLRRDAIVSFVVGVHASIRIPEPNVSQLFANGSGK